MQITIELETNNAAFEDAPELEAARILRHLSDRIERHGLIVGESIPLRDHNGNKVGHCKIEED